jgi:hypothetical protein
MKNTILFSGITLLFLCCSNYHSTVKISQGKTVNGYVVFVGDEAIIFVPNDKPKTKATFDDLQREVGLDIKGYMPDELSKLKEIGNNYDVTIRLVDNTGSEEFDKYLITIIPVELSYKTTPSPKIDSTAVPFMYKGKSYLIIYVFNYDLTVLDVRPYFKKGARRLKKISSPAK